MVGDLQKKPAKMKLIKGERYANFLPVTHQSPPIQQIQQRPPNFNPFRSVSSPSQQLSESSPHLTSSSHESPLIIGPTGLQITIPTVLQCYFLDHHHLGLSVLILLNGGQTQQFIGDRIIPARSLNVHWYLPMKDIWNCDSFPWNTYVNIIDLFPLA